MKTLYKISVHSRVYQQRRPLPLQQLVLTETSAVQKVSIKVTSHSMGQRLFFSLDAGPQSLPPLVCRLVDIGLFKVSPRLPSVTASAEPSHGFLYTHFCMQSQIL